MSNVSGLSARLCAALSEVLRDARLAAELSLGAVAELSGLNRQAITFIERGDRKPNAETIAKLALALGMLPSDAWKRAEDKLWLSKWEDAALNPKRKKPRES